MITVLVLDDTLPQMEDHIDLVSDAAVHVLREKGAICWQAASGDNKRLSACRHVEVKPFSYSYRHELIG